MAQDVTRCEDRRLERYHTPHSGVKRIRTTVENDRERVSKVNGRLGKEQVWARLVLERKEKKSIK